MIRDGMSHVPDAALSFGADGADPGHGARRSGQAHQGMEAQTQPPPRVARAADELTRGRARQRAKCRPVGPLRRRRRRKRRAGRRRGPRTNSAAEPPRSPARGRTIAAMPGASSGFLRSAATTAAGIAGGALLFSGISSLFGPHYGNLLAVTPQPGLGETVVNNYSATRASRRRPIPELTIRAWSRPTTGCGRPGFLRRQRRPQARERLDI